ncbi:hypothetical protein [Streptomyces sp. NPDC058240]|uniref:hypothetical protein n=1 Tax=Streptomyces sp. NPDC058240 TaxID=3346396 RepID=UPI0036E65F0E
MIAISDAEFSQVNDLATSSLLRYLRGHGWSPFRDYGRGQLWVLDAPGESGEPYEVMVPLDRGPRDYADRVADLVETLSVVEARLPADVLREMALPSADWQFLRLTPPGPSGTAPLVELVPALAGLRDLMTSAAAAVAAPEPQRPGAVTIAEYFDDRDGRRARRVRMSLDERDYGKAAEAHRRGDEVIVRGDVTARSGVAGMENIVSFTVRHVSE